MRTLRRIIAAYCHRWGMSARRFGQPSVVDSSLGTTLARGRFPRLSDIDWLLAFIEAEPIGPAFEREVEAFLKATGTKRSVLGARAAGDPSFVSRLRRGASPRLVTVEHVRAWTQRQRRTGPRRIRGDCPHSSPGSGMR